MKRTATLNESELNGPIYNHKKQNDRDGYKFKCF